MQISQSRYVERGNVVICVQGLNKHACGKWQSRAVVKAM